MDPPLPSVALPPHHPTTTIMSHQNTSGSPGSTPRFDHNGPDWEEPLPPVPGSKLRLMCSYGGHIIPRPHDKRLCYVGGETWIVGVDRTAPLHELHSRLSRSLLDGRRFTLKYQLPNEDLDSLISVATDEDLENMMEEYDRIMAANSGGPLKGNNMYSSRLRLFLFFAKPETAMTMGALLDDAKSETWFVDALNGADILPRVLSDSAAIDLLSLDSGNTDPGCLIPAASSHDAAPPKIASQDVQSIQSVMPDSPMIDTTTSSFDSSTSSPSMAHFSPIRVRVENSGGAPRLPEELKGGLLDEQFSTHLGVTPPLPTTILTPSTVAVTNASSAGGNNESSLNRVVSNNERSDHAVHVVSRKPPLPLPIQPVQHRVINGGFNLSSPDSKHAGGYNLPSPDSVASDNSIASATSFSKAVVPQDPAAQVANLIDNTKLSNTKPNSDEKSDNTTHTLQSQTHIYPPPQHQDHQQQPQFIHPNMHYIPAHTPIPSYYPVYATQQPVQPSQVDAQQYPMYLLPVNQTQPYNMAVQPTEPTVYPTAPNHTHFQPQYVGYKNPVARPMAGVGATTYGNYDYNHDHQHHQVYYTAQMAATATTTPVAASQYQSMTPAQAVMIAEASMQLPAPDSIKQLPRTP